MVESKLWWFGGWGWMKVRVFQVHILGPYCQHLYQLHQKRCMWDKTNSINEFAAWSIQKYKGGHHGALRMRVQSMSVHWSNATFATMQDLIWAVTANKMIGGTPKRHLASLVCWNRGVVSRIKEKKNLWYCELPKCHLILVHSYLVRNVNELESTLGSSSEQLEWWKTYSRKTLLKNRNVF